MAQGQNLFVVVFLKLEGRGWYGWAETYPTPSYSPAAQYILAHNNQTNYHPNRNSSPKKCVGKKFSNWPPNGIDLFVWYIIKLLDLEK